MIIKDTSQRSFEFKGISHSRKRSRNRDLNAFNPHNTHTGTSHKIQYESAITYPYGYAPMGLGLYPGAVVHGDRTQDSQDPRYNDPNIRTKIIPTTTKDIDIETLGTAVGTVPYAAHPSRRFIIDDNGPADSPSNETVVSQVTGGQRQVVAGLRKAGGARQGRYVLEQVVDANGQIIGEVAVKRTND